MPFPKELLQREIELLLLKYMAQSKVCKSTCYRKLNSLHDLCKVLPSAETQGLGAAGAPGSAPLPCGSGLDNFLLL